MNPNTHSVCKYCQKSVAFRGNYWLQVETNGYLSDELCAVNPNGRHEAEPVAEPASTGEPPESFGDPWGGPDSTGNEPAARPSEPSAPRKMIDVGGKEHDETTQCKYSDCKPAPQTNLMHRSFDYQGETLASKRPAPSLTPSVSTPGAFRAEFSLSPAETHAMVAMEDKNMIATIIANEFSKQLRQQLTAEQMEEVIRLNAAEQDKVGICHTHDLSGDRHGQVWPWLRWRWAWEHIAFHSSTGRWHSGPKRKIRSG